MGADGSRSNDLSAPRARVLAVLAAALLGASSLSAQTVTGQQNLSFGNLVQGVPVSVSHTNGARAARFTAAAFLGLGLSMRLTFTLPASMTGPGGATVPLTFGSTDGGYSCSNNVNAQTQFDPRTPKSLPLLCGAATVWLGGKASPSASQTAGNYTGVITLTVATL